jgi:class 3 adenylate cyclase
VGEHSRQEVARRAGVDPGYVDRLVELGILRPGTGDEFSQGDVLRARWVQSLERAGVPLVAMAAVRDGALSFAYLDASAFDRFAGVSGTTFQRLSEQTGIPLDLLKVVREAFGFAEPTPEDLVREDELSVVPLIELQLSSGVPARRHRAVAPGLRGQSAPDRRDGDGLVVFYFGDPGQGVLAALDMVEGVATHALPPARVGIHAGPVVFQEGDYFGRTVNIAARIAEYARPGEVLVTQEVVDAADGIPVAFTEIGQVELKGVSGTLRLHTAHRGG